MQLKSKFSSMLKVLLCSFLILAIGVTGVYEAASVQAASNAVPSYEVKFLLDSSKVLKTDHTFQSQVQQVLKVSEDSLEQYAVEYFDTNNLALNDAGWTVRFRKKEDKKNYELTYKKRFTIENGDIQGALTLANQQGFDSSDTNYEAEIDWGYNKQTLSFSNKKSESTSKGLHLPSADEALAMLVEQIPGKLTKTNGNKWGKETLLDSRVYGPITVSRYNGEFAGLETDIELWPILNEAGTGLEDLVEISFKTNSYNEAAQARESLKLLLDEHGWLIHKDGLKTNLILSRY